MIPKVPISLGVFACVLFGFSSCVAHARTAWDLPEFASATAALKDGDCKRAWEFVWPLAKQGNHEAQYFLRSAMIGKLKPAGFWSQPETDRTRQLLNMAAHAALAREGANPFQGDPNHRWARKEIPLLINQLGLGSKGDRAAQCYRSTASFRDCLTMAISLGVVQKFEDHAREVDAAADKCGISATCWYPHEPPPFCY